MTITYKSVALVATLLVVTSVAAQASPLCVKERKPFTLTDDTMQWKMTIAPGAECIQGLRWSYMQIYNVSVVSGPTKGHLTMVGPGFRYVADADSQSSDKFTLRISGKNRHDVGISTLEVEIQPAAEASGTQVARFVADADS